MHLNDDMETMNAQKSIVNVDAIQVDPGGLNSFCTGAAWPLAVHG